MSKRGRLFMLIACGVLLSGCVSVTKDAPKSIKPDRSLASALYTIGTSYEASRAEGDSLGMAAAVYRRRSLYETLSLTRDELSPAMRALDASTRQMMRASREVAAQDPAILAKFDSIIAGETRGVVRNFGQMGNQLGNFRRVVATIGFEMEAVLEPGVPQSSEVPVDLSAATTIFVQPKAAHVSAALDLVFIAERVGGADFDAPACNISGERRQLACLVQPGDFTGLRLTLENTSKTDVSVIIFVSGNDASVAAASAAKTDE